MFIKSSSEALFILEIMLYIKVQILGQRLPLEVGVKYTFHLERKSDEALKLG